MPSPARSDQGQATVELALCLPIVCLMLLGVVQVGLVVRDQLAVQLVAREAARAAVVAADQAGAGARTGTAAAGAAGISPIEVSVATGAGSVTVTVVYIEHTDVPIIGAFLPDVRITASATMALEPP